VLRYAALTVDGWGCCGEWCWTPRASIPIKCKASWLTSATRKGREAPGAALPAEVERLALLVARAGLDSHDGEIVELLEVRGAGIGAAATQTSND
jgi:hypothetical protein